MYVAQNIIMMLVYRKCFKFTSQISVICKTFRMYTYLSNHTFWATAFLVKRLTAMLFTISGKDSLFVKIIRFVHKFDKNNSENAHIGSFPFWDKTLADTLISTLKVEIGHDV